LFTLQERPDLEKLKSDLTRQQNEFKITLKELEDNLLARLSTAEGNFLGDYELVENLETTKRTAAEIEVKKNTQQSISPSGYNSAICHSVTLLSNGCIIPRWLSVFFCFFECVLCGWVKMVNG
jgi:hypothetical protein